MLRRVECVPDPVNERLAVDGGLLLPLSAFRVGAADRNDEFGRLPFDAGGPSGSFPSSTSRHSSLNHYRKYTEESLISQTNSFDFPYDSVYYFNVGEGRRPRWSEEQKGMRQMSFLLMTRNEKNFDERGVEKTFADRQEAIDAANTFVKLATCAGAEAHVFFNGHTEHEVNKHGSKTRCTECGWTKGSKWCKCESEVA